LRLPESWTERLPALEQLEEPWEPFPRIALLPWIAFYLFFLYQQTRNGMLPGLMDGVFVPIHEGGHLLFRIAGEFLMIAGGTFLQLFAPFALATYFAFRRQPQGVAFCSFFFFTIIFITFSFFTFNLGPFKSSSASGPVILNSRRQFSPVDNGKSLSSSPSFRCILR